MASIETKDLTASGIDSLREKGWVYAAVYKTSAGKDTLVAELLFNPVPKRGEYIQIPGDKYRGREVSFFLHPTYDPTYDCLYDLFIYIGQAVH